jgi:hypothetical protein
MADTERGDFPNEICSDCGEKGCIFKHWGPLVPEGKIGSFCGYCWTRRNKSESHRIPLGFQPPGIPEEFIKRNLKVKTKSGAIYHLRVTDKDDERIVTKEAHDLDFAKARVICLQVGESMWLKPRDGEDLDLWYTSPILRIDLY